MSDPVAHLHDTTAEAALLGAMMLRQSVVEKAGRVLVSADFYMPAHGTIFDAALDLFEAGHPAEPQLLKSQLGDRLNSVGGATALLMIQSRTPGTSAADSYIDRIKECSNRRHIYRTAQDTLARLENGVKAAEASDLMVEDLGRVELVGGGRELVTESFESLVNAPESTLPEWVIPGVMRRGNRMMITAPTKTGKATMIRQMAFATSRGIHPFTRNPIEERRVLLLDLENPRETYIDPPMKMMLDRLDRMRPQPSENNLQVLMRGQGLNLLARSDRLLVEDLLRRQRPDILCICPVYKSFTKKGNEDAETTVRDVCEIYDHLRTTYDCALILEHHSPRGSIDLFPFGSSVWERWVDFGRTMRRSEANPKYVEWGTFCAGDRLPVSWPDGFHEGNRGFPFEPQWPDGYIDREP